MGRDIKRRQGEGSDGNISDEAPQAVTELDIPVSFYDNELVSSPTVSIACSSFLWITCRNGDKDLTSSLWIQYRDLRTLAICRVARLHIHRLATAGGGRRWCITAVTSRLCHGIIKSSRLSRGGKSIPWDGWRLLVRRCVDLVTG